MSKQIINKQTSFMGVSINDDGPQNLIILKALAHPSPTVLGIDKFIEVTDFKLNMVMFDYFWQVMVGNKPVHLARLALEWFGYEGEYSEQKRKFTSLLKRNAIIYDEISHDNKHVNDFPSIKEELLTLPKKALVNSKFLIMHPKDIKMAIMQLKTKNGHIIRQYYIDLEELMKLYVEYTLYFNKRTAEYELDRAKDKISNLEQMMADMSLLLKKQEIVLNEVKDQNNLMLDQNDEIQGELAVVQDKLDTSLEDRCPKVLTKNRLEQFVLIKKNKPSDQYPYYVICGQQVYVTSRITSLARRYPRMTIILKLQYQPNTKNLFGRFKETHKDDVVVKMNDIQLVTLNESELIEAFEELDDEKLNI